jgi:hypothetical protein
LVGSLGSKVANTLPASLRADLRPDHLMLPALGWRSGNLSFLINSTGYIRRLAQGTLHSISS